MITRIARRALCISIFRPVPRGQLARQLLVRMEQHGTVDKPLSFLMLNRILIDKDGGQIVYYKQTSCPQTLASGYKSSCTC